LDVCDYLFQCLSAAASFSCLCGVILMLFINMFPSWQQRSALDKKIFLVEHPTIISHLSNLFAMQHCTDLTLVLYIVMEFLMFNESVSSTCHVLLV
jgi:hypothetical protein